MSHPKPGVQLKFSGQKKALPAVSPEIKEAWKFEFRPGGWVIATREHAGKVERRRFFFHRDRDRFWAKVGADFYGQKVEPTRGSAGGGGQNDFTAQFPGKVRKVLVQSGAQVQAGDALLMVEAMKMEFAIKAETAGVVTQVLVQEGQQLSPGQKLLDFKEAEENSK